MGLVVEDALKKFRELWLVLQDMQKAYNSVGWEHLEKSLVRIKMCSNGSPISITKKGESHCYLDIFLFTKDLSKPSLAKAHSDVRFFTNLVLKKAILDKQFSYLVSSVLYPIVYYRTQFSFVPLSMCNKWDTLICKGLKSKSGLSLDFPNDALHHPSLYSLKTFEQIQAECKLALVVSFANSVGILGCLFSHRAHDLQVFSWHPLYPLCFPAYVKVPLLNNFLAGVVCVFLNYNLSFSNSMASAFCFRNGTPLHSALFSSPPYVVDNLKPLNILESSRFDMVHNNLLGMEANSLSVYTDGSVAGLRTTGIKAGAAAFFEDVGMGLGIEVSGLVSSILVELQAIALALEHFICGIFWSIYCARWEVGSGSKVVVDDLLADIDWYRSSLVWHLDLHMAAGFTSKHTAGACSYFMKALYHQLPVVICKHFYDKCYPSMMCLFCGDVKVSDHMFTCISDMTVYARLLDSHAAIWKSLSGLAWSSSCVMQLMSPDASNGVVAGRLVVEFVWDFCLAFRDKVWLVRAKHRTLIEKNGLIPKDGFIPVSVSGLSTTFSADVVKLLGISEAFGISSGLHKTCLFFSGIGNLASVHIGA
ncbi:hypothetical protein G9A89_007631 [Geosiphon pyriformis]|nr:hypothetical protein G9A89_007631 [Geosiphon pyriformis]